MSQDKNQPPTDNPNAANGNQTGVLHKIGDAPVSEFMPLQLAHIAGNLGVGEVTVREAVSTTASQLNPRTHEQRFLDRAEQAAGLHREKVIGAYITNATEAAPGQRRSWASKRLATALVAAEIKGFTNGTSVLPSGLAEKIIKPTSELLTDMAAAKTPDVNPMDAIAIETLKPTNGLTVEHMLPPRPTFKPPVSTR